MKNNDYNLYEKTYSKGKVDRYWGTRIENIRRKKEKSVYLVHYVKDSIAYKKLGGLLSFIMS